MLKTIGVLSLLGICVVAVIGLAGGGPVWFRYVGSSTLFLLLLAILGRLKDVVDKLEKVPEEGSPKEAFDLPPDAPVTIPVRGWGAN